eukprot:GEMP01043867.1.p1 GENE.GEMP01043867.1~~GEMP01043867.1.p1  ORF type:complete len:230 (+),score=31.39 GEMP01043867.1:28-717(+)
MLQPSKGEAGESIVTVPLGKTLDSQPKAPSLVETLDKIRESDPKKYVTLPGITTHHILAAFNNMDLDKNGYIGAMELRCILNQLGHDSSDEIIDEMIRMVDSEGIGQCSVEDYWRLLHSAAFVSEMQALKPGVKESALELKMKGNAILQNNVKNFTQTLTTREAGQKCPGIYVISYWRCQSSGDPGCDRRTDRRIWTVSRIGLKKSDSDKQRRTGCSIIVKRPSTKKCR